MKNLKSYQEFIFEDIQNIDDKKILNNIIEWVYGKSDRMKIDSIARFLNSNLNKIKDLSKIKPEIYQSPLGEVCYRGLEKISNIKEVVDIMSKGLYKVTKAPGYEGFIKAIEINNYDYSPRRLAQSWSIDPDVAWRFANTGIILETQIDSNFIMNPKYMSELNKSINKSGSSSGLAEDEVIHLGKSYKNVTLFIDLNSIEKGNPIYPYIKKLI
jgi:hypothetical protein